MDTMIEVNGFGNRSDSVFESASKFIEQILMHTIKEYKMQDVHIHQRDDGEFVLSCSDFSQWLSDREHEYCNYDLRTLINETIDSEDNVEYLMRFSKFLRECSYAVERKIHDTQ